MISEEIISILAKNKELRNFTNNIEEYDMISKRLTDKDIERLRIEYPRLLPQIISQDFPLLCLTFIKREFKGDNYTKLKKIKIYINEESKEIFKVLGN